MKTAKNKQFRLRATAAAAVFASLVFMPVSAPAQMQMATPSSLTYADLADLTIPAKLVIRAQIRKQAPLAPEQSPHLRPGWVRLYVEAQTLALLGGNMPIGESLSYLVDVPLDARGKVPKLRKQDVILFASPVPGKPGQLQLVDVDAQLPATPELEARVKTILTELASPDAPPAVRGVRDALSVAGNLPGESETQLFLDAEDGASVALSVIRRPGMAPQWGVSWSELVDQSARAPEPQTLDWYRLACSLPQSLPADAILSRDGTSRFRAAEDYRLVLEQLGPCRRTRR